MEDYYNRDKTFSYKVVFWATILIFLTLIVGAQTLKVTKELLCSKQKNEWSDWSTILITNNPIKITLKNDVLSISNYNKEIFHLGIMIDRFSGKYISTGKVFIAYIYNAIDKNGKVVSVTIYKIRKKVTAIRIERNNSQVAFIRIYKNKYQSNTFISKVS